MTARSVLVLALAACGGAAPRAAPDVCATKPLPAIVSGAPRVVFQGNHAFSADELRAVMQIGRGLWAATLEDDVVALWAFYYDHGYWNAKVDVPVVTDAGVRITIDEGPRYRLRSLTFKDHGEALEPEARAHLVGQRGQWIRRCAMLSDLDRLRAAYKAAGFGDASVEPMTELFPNEGAVDVTIDVTPGAKGAAHEPHTTYHTCSGALIDLMTERGCTRSTTRPQTMELPPLDPKSVDVSLDGGDGWTERDRAHDLLLVVKNTSSQFVRFRFEQNCGKHGGWGAAGYLPTGTSVDTASWEGCPTLKIEGVGGCMPDVYDVELPPGGVLRRELAFLPSRSVTPTRCHQTLEPLPRGNYEVRAVTPIPIANGGWLTASITMEVR
jgi:hypothetical protein